MRYVLGAATSLGLMMIIDSPKGSWSVIVGTALLGGVVGQFSAWLERIADRDGA